MTNKFKKDSDNELENNEDEVLSDENSDEFNDNDNDNENDNENENDIDNELGSHLLTEEFLNDKENTDIDYIDDNHYYNNNISKNEYLIGEDRISVNRLTKYEMVRILGERVKQLIMGAKPMIKNYKELSLSYEAIAEHELINSILPFKIRK